jgi:hypothetical protein
MAEPALFDGKVGFRVRQLFGQRHEQAVVGLQCAAQVVGQVADELARGAPVSRGAERRDRVERVEEEVRLQLVAQRAQFRLACQLQGLCAVQPLGLQRPGVVQRRMQSGVHQQRHPHAIGPAAAQQRGPVPVHRHAATEGVPHRQQPVAGQCRQAACEQQQQRRDHTPAATSPQGALYQRERQSGKQEASHQQQSLVPGTHMPQGLQAEQAAAGRHAHGRQQRPAQRRQDGGDSVGRAREIDQLAGG